MVGKDVRESRMVSHSALDLYMLNSFNRLLGCSSLKSIILNLNSIYHKNPIIYPTVGYNIC